MRARVLIVSFILLALTLTFVTSQFTRPAFGQPQNTGVFFDTGQSLGNHTSHGVAVAELDGNPGADAFVANSTGSNANTVWLNDGAGIFTSNLQSLGSEDSEDVALANVDGINGIDAVVANSSGSNRVWLNDGSGQFSGGQAFDTSVSRGVGLDNLDADSDPDVFFANQNGNTVWLNQSGTFTNTSQSLGTANSYAVALGDLDGDGDNDAFVGNGGGAGQPDKVWINQGGSQGGTPGFFLDSGQSLGFAWTYDIALGDLDADGDLDAFAAHWFPNANSVYINQGGVQAGTEGVFLDSGQTLGSAASLGIALADIDNDTDLDAFITNNLPAGNKVWLNNGSGIFTDSGQSLDTSTTHYDVALQDLDGDSDPDAFVASFGPNRVFRNGPSNLPTATFAVTRETNDTGDEVYYQAVSGDAMIPVMLSNIYTATLDVHAGVEFNSSLITTTIQFDPGEQMDFLNLVNPDPNPNETYTMTLSVTLDGVPPTPSDQTDDLLFTFIDGDQGLDECILCFIEWLGQFVGLDPIFDQLFAMSLSEQRASNLWPYYTTLFDFYSPEMSTIMATNPPLLWDALETIDEWTPAIDALSDGTGNSTTVSQEMVEDADALFNDLAAKASPGLAAMIQQEQDAIDFPSLAGMNMDEVWNAVEERRPIEFLYATIILQK